MPFHFAFLFPISISYFAFHFPNSILFPTFPLSHAIFHFPFPLYRFLNAIPISHFSVFSIRTRRWCRFVLRVSCLIPFVFHSISVQFPFSITPYRTRIYTRTYIGPGGRQSHVHGTYSTPLVTNIVHSQVHLRSLSETTKVDLRVESDLRWTWIIDSLRSLSGRLEASQVDLTTLKLPETTQVACFRLTTQVDMFQAVRKCPEIQTSKSKLVEHWWTSTRGRICYWGLK